MAALCSLALLSPGAGAHPAQAPPAFFGVNGQHLRSAQQSPNLDQQVAQIRGLGISWVRLNFPWRQLEPLPPLLGNHSYLWGQFDNVVAALARHGLRLQPVLLTTPAWAADPGNPVSCGGDAEPAAGSYDDYAAALGALAARYGAGGSFWAENPGLASIPVRQYEVWNEPNLRFFWCPAPSPERYAALFGAASAAVRAVDPAAQVGIGGLSPVRTTGGDRIEVGAFLRRAVDSRPALRQEASLVFAHPYARTAADVIRQLPWWREAIDAASLRGKPIVTNEWGWHTRGGASETGPVGEPQRAGDFGYVANRMSRTDCGVVGTAPHTWVSRELNPGDSEDWFGIASAAAAGPYPTGLAYGNQIALLGGRAQQPPPTGIVRGCGPPCALTGFRAKRKKRGRPKARRRVVLKFNSRRAVRVRIAVHKKKRRGKWRRMGQISKRIPEGRSRKRWSGKVRRRKVTPKKTYRLEATVVRDSIGCGSRVAKLKKRKRKGR